MLLIGFFFNYVLTFEYASIAVFVQHEIYSCGNHLTGFLMFLLGFSQCWIQQGCIKRHLLEHKEA